MINLVAVRENLLHEMVESARDKDGKVFITTMGLAEIMLEAFDGAISALGKSENGVCFVDDKNEYTTKINSVISGFKLLLEMYAGELKELENSTYCPAYVKDQINRVHGKMEAALACWNILKQTGDFEDE